MKRFAVIVAGGIGTRMQSAVPKQFLELKGRPILMHTMERFHQAGEDIRLILVLPEAHFDLWEAQCKALDFGLPHQRVAGGETRFHSVYNGISAITEEGLVAVHDAVRPLLTTDFINRLYETAARHGQAVPVLPLTETLREREGVSSRTVDRSKFVIVQTPQVFRVKELQRAFAQPYRSTFTDEATVMEESGTAIQLCEGERMNIKLTTPFDMQLAQVLMNTMDSGLF